MRAHRLGVGSVAVLLAGLVLAQLAVAVGDRAHAVPEPAPTPTEGVLLPSPVAPLAASGVLTGVSADLVLHGRSAYSELRPHRTTSVVRVADGSTVRAFETFDGPTALAPELRGTSLVQLVEVDAQRREVEVRDAVTGTLQRSIEVPDGALLHAEPSWAMVNAVGASTADNTVSFLRDGGSRTTVDGSFSQPPTWHGGDEQTVYLGDSRGDYAVDTVTGRRTALDLGAGHLFFVTPTHLVTRQSTASGVVYRAFDRDGLQPHWSTELPADHRNRVVLPYGAGLAVLHLADGAAWPEEQTLRPVDLATGELEPPVAEQVVQARAMPDGRTSLVLGDTVPGRLAVASGATVVPLADLPEVPTEVRDVAVVAGRALTSFAGRDGVWAFAGDGTPGWSEARPSHAYAGGDPYQSFSAAGDVVMSQDDRVVRPRTRFHLTWPGGQRDLTGTTARLGHGGRYVTVVDHRRAAGRTDVVEVRSGDVVASRAGYAMPVVDGTWSWSVSARDGMLRGTDLTGTAAAQVVELPPGCTDAQLSDVRGRWASLACESGGLVLDVHGQLETHEARTSYGAQLGDGFVAELDVEPGVAPDPGVVRLVVSDLVTGETRAYGPLRGLSWMPGAAIGLGEGAPAELVYADPRSQARHVALPWVTTDGTAPPALLTSPDLPAWQSSVSARDVPLVWSFRGATTYDVRRRERDAADWARPAAWQGIGQPSVVGRVDPGAGACFSARAHDAAGRVSRWSAPVCSSVDGEAPRVVSEPRVPAVVGSATEVGLDLAWTWADPASGRPGAEGIASYDVRRGDRRASGWTLPPQWQGLDRAEVSTTIAGGQGACFSSRATDLAGNESAWTPPVCQYVDDAAPRLVSQSLTPLFPRTPRSRVSYRATAVDDEGMAYHEVQRATAARGRGLGEWGGYGPMTGAATSVQGPGTATCFRSRAVDAVGNASGWSSATCSSAPIDDRDLATAGRASRVRAGGGIGPGYLRLDSRGARAVLRGETGRSVGVWIRTGPRLGSAVVVVDRTRVGRISFRSRTVGSRLVLLPVPGGYDGDVRIVSTGRAPVHVDGVVAVR